MVVENASEASFMYFVLRAALPLFLIVLSAAPSQAQAQGQSQTYPNRPVRIVVPFAPGGVTDVMARLLAQKLSENLGKEFFVDNRAGAGGNIGTGVAATAPADGYTLVLTSSSYVVNPSIHAKIPYDPEKDLTPVTISAVSPNIVTVNPSLPVRSISELIAYVRQSGKASFASAGVATTPHLSGELFRLSLDLDMVHVPFGGAGPALQSAIAGHTPIAFTGFPPAVPLVKAGSLRALAVTSARRLAALPDLPTMAEAGVPDQEAETMLIILVPSATPREIVALLHREIAKIVALPETKQRLETLGFEPLASTPADSATRIRQELSRWAKVVRDAKITVQNP
jgi:tripartite-type tricarboxylate transporter receptor subunit TctC